MRPTDSSIRLLEASKPLCHSPSEIIDVLEARITEARRERMVQVASTRIPNVAAVLDDIADPHNCSAILRSCDAFGVHHVHAFTQGRPFLVSHKVAKGTERWLNIDQHSDVEKGVEHLRSQGFKIYVASMEGSLSPEELQEIPRLAIVLGNEHRGPRKAIRDLADGTYSIPMCGFVESLNVSVAAAVTLYTVTRNREHATNKEAAYYYAQYLMNSVDKSDAMVKRFYEELAHDQK